MSTTAQRAAGRAERVQQKRRTRRLLLAAAAQLVAGGDTPSVAEVADAADVSRRTAYRYFPTQEQMLVEAALEGLRPAMEAALESTPAGRTDADLEARVDAMARNMMRLAADHEALLRTMIRLTVSRPHTDDQPPRGTRRLDWIEAAVHPLRQRLGAAAYSRLVSALAVAIGTEAFIVLRDVCGLSAGRTEDLVAWMARALLRQSLRPEDPAASAIRRRPARPSSRRT